MRKTIKQLEAELDAANKRCAELADALVKAVKSPAYVQVYIPSDVPNPYVLPLVWYSTTVGDISALPLCSTVAVKS